MTTHQSWSFLCLRDAQTLLYVVLNNVFKIKLGHKIQKSITKRHHSGKTGVQETYYYKVTHSKCGCLGAKDSHLSHVCRNNSRKQRKKNVAVGKIGSRELRFKYKIVAVNTVPTFLSESKAFTQRDDQIKTGKSGFLKTTISKTAVGQGMSYLIQT